MRDHRGPRGPVIRDHRTGGGSDGGGGDGGSGGNYASYGDELVLDGGYSNCCAGGYDVVGYGADGYGSWGRALQLPHFAFEFGTGMRRFADPVGTMNTLAGEGGYDVVGGAGVDSAVTTQMRMLVGLSGPLYIGVEGEIGGLVSAPPIRAVSERLPTMEARSGMVLGATALVGAMWRTGRSALGIELAAGGRSVVYEFDGHGAKFATTAGGAVVEPRVRAEYWLSPWFAAGAMAGANVVASGDWMAAGYLSVHTRAFGGR
ncbi:MAG: hypothetical protein H0T79_20215 [Deltaproteobacteria bacterium]|nr:hypothetical protein [Deltaproteobacteria bacterium]